MQGAKGSGNARKETRERERERAGSKKREEEGERGGRATGLENERRDMPVNGNGLECTRRVNQKKEKSREGRKRGEEGRKGKRVREGEGKRAGLCSRPSQYVLVASVCPFVPVHVRTSVRCLPWHSNRVHSRLAPVEGL